MASRTGGDCVKVAVRVRPLIGTEIAKGDNECVVTYPAINEPQIQIGGDKNFTFDYLFRNGSSQKEVYVDCIKPLVSSFLEGYNATVIAYGQTGSGKTYTMGTLGCDDSKLQEEWGVIPSAIHDIFSTLSQRATNDYQVQCSFIEIYNEQIKDLLDTHSSKTLAIRENAEGPSKIHIPNMKLETVHDAMGCAEALDRGGASRATAYTQMNAQSSRSHAIFTVHLHHIRNNGDKDDEEEKAEPVVIQSKFHFVDLAGSERAKKTGAVGTRLMEGISINQGLLALGNVIAALGDARLKGKHVPFRDSKITRLLQDSLGGNSRTLMIACISPARSNMLETKNTLNYANRAKNIKNKAVVNRDPRSRKILELRERVKELEAQLNNSNNGNNNNNHNHNRYNNNNNNNDNEYEQEIERMNQLQSDLNESNHEVIRLQEKVKNLRLNLSELQDKYYNKIGIANTDIQMEKLKRMELMDKIKEKYPEFDFEKELKSYSESDGNELKNQIEIIERQKLEIESLQTEKAGLQRTIISSETRDQHFVHNLHDQMAKLVRGDFSVMDHDLISPSKRFDVSSSTESIPELSFMSSDLKERNDMILLVDDDADEEDEETEEEDEEDDDDDINEAEEDDDHDISMKDPKKEELKRENKIKVKETSTERNALKQEKRLNIDSKKKLMKEQKCHLKQMEFIANEQRSRERSQQLKSEKYNREIVKTNRDIFHLQTMLKQLCKQRQSDVGKQSFYEKQIHTLSNDLDEAHRQGQLYEVEKEKLNPNDIKKLQAQEMKISNYRTKVKSLEIQIKSFREKLGQIRKLQSLHREDMMKMNQMTRKLSDLKKKKVNLQRKLKEENKVYARWKQQTEKTIKQLRKVQREKNIQLQRHKTALSKTKLALKAKTLALMTLKKKQKEMVIQNRRNTMENRKRKNGRRGRNHNRDNTKQIKSAIAKLLSSLIIKHQLFSKYKLFDREYKSLQHDLKASERSLSDVMMVLNQLNTDNEDDEERQRLITEKLEYEQRFEDTQSTIKYIREQMIGMSHKMKDTDHKRWKQLQNAQKVSLSCSEHDLDRFLLVPSIVYARQCINFLINQHLRFRLIIDDYKKQTKHLKSEQNRILLNADNEMRKKVILIEKLQNSINEERAKYRLEQIKDLDEDVLHNYNNEDSEDHNKMNIDNDTDNDNDCDDDLDLNNRNPKDTELIPFETDLERDLKQKEDELNQSKSLLNLFCSPQHRERINPNTNGNGNAMDTSFSVQSSSSCSRFNQNMNSWRHNMNKDTVGKRENTVLELTNKQISVQLTPFHTPMIRSKTKSTRSNASSTEYNSFLSNNNNNNSNNTSNQPHNHNDNISQRSNSHSPLFVAHSIDVHNVLNENNHAQSNRIQSNNVFSRLTNPNSYVSTSRTRAQELQALKQKAKKQKVSHSQILPKRTYLQKRKYQSPQHNSVHNNNNDMDAMYLAVDSDHNMEDAHHNNNNSSVFDRLHTTSIRNTRYNEVVSISERETTDNHNNNDLGSLGEGASRINVNYNTQYEMTKKPQRNVNNDSKSMLLNPVRVLTPDC